MSHIVLIECPDQRGLITKVTEVLFSKELNIISNLEYVDRFNKRFFMRTEVEGNVHPDELKRELTQVLPQEASLQVKTEEKKKALILATKEAHCIGDLMLRCWNNGLNMDIQGVISNHNVLKDLVDRFDLPYHFISHDGLDRKKHEQLMMDIIDQYNPDLIILAKYMRILSEEFIQRYPNKIINIHHSFLPAFIGAKPYHQAYERGVKIIGATSHFVTSDLDQGPIIAQQVIPVDHSHSAEDMARSGQDVEKFTLAKAIQLVTEGRVFISGNRTIVFD